MEALQALARANLDISEARNTLLKLQETETEYLVSREKKALDRVQKTLELSHNLVEETNKNYESIQDLAKMVAQGFTILDEASKAFSQLVEARDKKFELWERDITNQETTVAASRNALRVELSELDSQKSQLKSVTLGLAQDKRKFQDEKGIVERQIQRLKENRI